MLFWLLNPRNSMASNDLFPQVLRNPCYVVYFFSVCYAGNPCHVDICAIISIWRLASSSTTIHFFSWLCYLAWKYFLHEMAPVIIG